MPKYRVYPYMTVSTSREVEAEDAAAAADKVLNEGLPGLMFLDHSYPDEGEWEINDEDIETVEDES